MTFRVLGQTAPSRLATLSDVEEGYIAEAFSALELATTGALRVLVIGSASDRLGGRIADRGHNVALVSAPGAPARRTEDAPGTSIVTPAPVRLIARCVQLPFRDEGFDVVVWAAAFDGAPPGLDRVALWEMARVLQPAGHLVVTFDVMSRDSMKIDEQAVEQQASEAFSWADVRRLVDRVSQSFVVSPFDLPDEIEQSALSDAAPPRPYRRKWATPDQAAARTRTVVGAVLKRRASVMKPLTATVMAGYIEAQQHLRHQVETERAAASRSALLVDRLEALVATMASEVATVQVEREAVASLAEARLTIMYEQSRGVDELHLVTDQQLDVIQQLEARTNDLQRTCDRRLDVIRQLEARANDLQQTCDQRLDVIRQLEAHANDLQQTCDRRLDVIRQLEAHANDLQQTCDQRLDVIQQLEARANDLQQTCDQRLDVIADLDRAARERLDRLNSLLARCPESPDEGARGSAAERVNEPGP